MSQMSNFIEILDKYRVASMAFGKEKSNANYTAMLAAGRAVSRFAEAAFTGVPFDESSLRRAVRNRLDGWMKQPALSETERSLVMTAADFVVDVVMEVARSQSLLVSHPVPGGADTEGARES